MKRRMKRVLSVLVAVLLLAATTCPAALAAKSSGKCGPNAKWTYDSKKKTLTVSGKGAVTLGIQARSKTSVKLVIKKGITSIKAAQFLNLTIKSVSLPNTLKSIDGGAFVVQNGQFASSITLPKSLKKIGANPFLGANGLKSIKVAKGSRSFSTVNGILYNRKRTKLLACPPSKTGNFTIPKGTKGIANAAFAYSKLNRLVIPASVTKVEPYPVACAPFKELVFLGKPPQGQLGIDSSCYAKNVFFREKLQSSWQSTIDASKTGGFAGKWWGIYKGQWA